MGAFHKDEHVFVSHGPCRCRKGNGHVKPTIQPLRLNSEYEGLHLGISIPKLMGSSKPQAKAKLEVFVAPKLLEVGSDR